MQTSVKGYPNGQIEVEADDSFQFEGVTYPRAKHYILTPDPNLNPPNPEGGTWAIEDEPAEVRAYCEAWWTPERLEAWAAHLADVPE